MKNSQSSITLNTNKKEKNYEVKISRNFMSLGEEVRNNTQSIITTNIFLKLMITFDGGKLLETLALCTKWILVFCLFLRSNSTMVNLLFIRFGSIQYNVQII